MDRRNAFLGAPFRTPFHAALGSFDAVPISGPPTGWISVPFPVIKFNIYNRYLPQYWPPYIPVEIAPGKSLMMRPEGS